MLCVHFYNVGVCTCTWLFKPKSNYRAQLTSFRPSASCHNTHTYMYIILFFCMIISVVTVMLSNTKTLWERGTSGNFTLQLEITYPTLSLTYTPGFWQVLKFAWIQYLSVLIILYVLVSWVRRFAFGNQIVPTIKKQPGITKQHTH